MIQADSLTMRTKNLVLSNDSSRPLRIIILCLESSSNLILSLLVAHILLIGFFNVTENEKLRFSVRDRFRRRCRTPSVQKWRVWKAEFGEVSIIRRSDINSRLGGGCGVQSRFGIWIDENWM